MSGSSIVRFEPVFYESEPAWFCIRSQPKREHIAAGNLSQIEGVEVFNPRLRVRRNTRRGPVWFAESLFPNYLFARFLVQSMLDQIRYSHGVSGVVHFGSQWPVVPEEVIDDLKSYLDGDQIKEIAEALVPGDQVRVITGAFNGLSAVVLKVLPPKQRVELLMNFLGRTTKVELGLSSVVSDPNLYRNRLITAHSSERSSRG